MIEIEIDRERERERERDREREKRRRESGTLIRLNQCHWNANPRQVSNLVRLVLKNCQQ